MRLLQVCMALIFCTRIVAQEMYHKQYELFNGIEQYPKINDEKAFIKALKQSVHFEDRPFVKQETINYFKKIKLFGSKAPLYLIEYDYHTGSTSAFPYKVQFLFTGKGKLLGTMMAIRVDTATILQGKDPFLFTVSSTGKGNGWHNVFRIKDGKMVDVYDGFPTNRPQTYAKHEGIAYNIPTELHHRFTDTNNDGFNDIVFSGKMSYCCIAIPDATIPVKYIFQYHPETGRFTPKEDYSKKYEYIFGKGN